MEFLVQSLCQHLLTPGERWALGHPMVTVFGVEFWCSAPQHRRLSARALNAEALEFVPGDAAGLALRQCARCNAHFALGRDAGCVHHWGRVVGSTNICCGSVRGAPGCRETRHVWSGTTLGRNGPFHDYVRSATLRGGVYAIDAEMIYTELGLEVARVALTDVNGGVVYDSLVQPSAPVVDYNTPHSGITQAVLDGAVKTLWDVRGEIFQIVGCDTILVGHAIENDLRALKIVHDLVVDTSSMFPHFRGLPWRHLLRGLCAEHLGFTIQCNSAGHSPVEDARAAMALVLWKLRA